MASLDISLNDIPSEGLDYASEVSRIDLDLGEEDPKFQGDLEFAGHIHAAETEAWVNGDLRGVLVLECVRCLGVFNSATDIPIEAYYRSQGGSLAKEKPKGSKKEDTESQDEEADNYFILDNSFNLAEMLREQLILSIPIQPLCQENCQGLCQVCGQNRNQQQCACEALRPESPFAILRDKLESSKKAKE